MKRILFAMIALLGIAFTSCTSEPVQQTSDSGITKATSKIQVNPATGLSAEQWNIEQKNIRDNEAGAIKHLYIISPYSGECILYSTVKGKVTSGSKRLSPKTVTGYNPSTVYRDNVVLMNNQNYTTDEVLGDDGAYGESNPIYILD
jgi:hypothetical protein